MAQQSTTAASARPAQELNERSAKAAQPGDVLRDASVRGLHLRCFCERKSFYLYYRTKAGQERKPKLGDYGSITLTQARKIAQELLARVAVGGDPQAEREAARAERTLAELWAEYWKRHGSKKKSAGADQGIWDRYLRDKLGSRKLSTIAYTDIADLHESMAAKPIMANRVLALASKMFSFAHKPLEWTDGRNPAKGVQRYRETKRKRYMRAEEAARIAAALAAESTENPASVAFIYLLILTGARKGEIASAKWSQLDGAKLVLQEHKTDATGHDRVIHLPPQAMAVIDRLPRTSGTITGIQSPQALWEKVRAAAHCPDLRLHDLRHSFASAAIGAGMTLAQIGELLGHTSTQTTARYAHLVEEAAAKAAAETANRIGSTMGL
ncbi:integrase [Ralstonia phage DU_RP_II]|nr:integrase [Ralstonia phage DU_RP_II]